MNNGILGKWIAAPGADRNFGAERCDSAPHFRREFEYEKNSNTAGYRSAGWDSTSCT